MEFKQTQILLEGYTSPVSKVIEIQPEGVLCESNGTFAPPTWGNDDETLDFD